MPNRSQIIGLEETNRRLRVIRESFDGPPIRRVCLQGARTIADQARRNVRRGLTGLLLRAIQAVSGRKASKQGALAIARVNAWVAPHAHLIEDGTRDHDATPEQAMKVPSAAMGAGAPMTAKGKFRAGASMAWSAGFLFFRRIHGTKATHFFERAVEEKLPGVQRDVIEGCRQIVEDAIRQ